MTSRSLEHLLRRATWGLTDGLVHEAGRLGARRWLAGQLDPRHVADPEMDTLARRWPVLDKGIWATRNSIPQFGWDAMFDLVDAHIARAIWSQRQLLEVMVDFWSNHLNVPCPNGDVWDSRHVFDRDVIRANALGSFSDMLTATGRSPAMLNYLGNAASTAADPNENWGRELLELHTVGVAAGYSQAEVEASARILTGLSVDDTTGEFLYRPTFHAVGPVRVLGFRSDNRSADGEGVAMDYLRYLAHHPRTATTIAHKLAVRFVADDPPASLVRHLAKVYRAHSTHVVPVLQALFGSKEFAGSEGAKLRTPYENVIATMRALDVGPPAKGTGGIRDVQWQTGQAGQAPLGWPQPNGYPDVAEAWATTTTTLGRWNLNMDHAAQWWPTDLAWRPVAHLLAGHRPRTAGALLDRLAAALHVPALTDGQRSALAGFIGHRPQDVLAADDAALGWRLPYLVALVLDSPQQANR